MRVENADDIEKYICLLFESVLLFVQTRELLLIVSLLLVIRPQRSVPSTAVRCGSSPACNYIIVFMYRRKMDGWMHE